MNIQTLNIYGGNNQFGEHSKQTISTVNQDKHRMEELLNEIKIYQKELSQAQIDQIMELFQKSQNEQTEILVAELLNLKEKPVEFGEKLEAWLSNAANAATVLSFIQPLWEIIKGCV